MGNYCRDIIHFHIMFFDKFKYSYLNGMEIPILLKSIGIPRVKNFIGEILYVYFGSNVFHWINLFQRKDI